MADRGRVVCLHLFHYRHHHHIPSLPLLSQPCLFRTVQLAHSSPLLLPGRPSHVQGYMSLPPPPPPQPPQLPPTAESNNKNYASHIHQSHRHMQSDCITRISHHNNTYHFHRHHIHHHHHHHHHHQCRRRSRQRTAVQKLTGT
ncbi:hypothetical protein E2C01_017952 [Portunus trituberculatus]|uniref:Uncharacterized protein n=1 Tax=Portunus trituberculatus TaxID=210409 RepID=A0A5B7DTU6_PORTR|nr:hypothetical protein [Portunus trituberculatus]